MKFSNGYWLTRENVTIIRPSEVHDVSIAADRHSMRVFAPTRPISSRGDTLNTPVLTVTFDAPAADVIGVRITHHGGSPVPAPTFPLVEGSDVDAEVTRSSDGASVTLRSGRLEARVLLHGPWQVEYFWDGRLLTASTGRSIGYARVAPGQAPVSKGYDNGAQPPETHLSSGGPFVYEQLSLSPGERLYGLGERFGAFVRNGQTVDIWNADGGTSSEQAYKNIPFLLSSQGYGVLVDDAGPVSFEIGSENVSATQFSVPGETLRYEVYGGGEPLEVLDRYTKRSGRPATLPGWSFGLWLSTSFTTSYDEDTVLSFVDGMAARGIPLTVFHFDCFWMRGFHWSDFEWDPETFPDPRGLIAKLHARGLRVCTWINPYIAERSRLFNEAAERGFLLRRTDGGVWQTDLWQAGMGLVDFTNPDATEWFTSKLEQLLDDGVDCFKTDFGERVPVDSVTWDAGSDPLREHNFYTRRYNEAVFRLLERRRGVGEAVLFARSATTGSQAFPVHWGGDCESTYSAMAQSLRGGLSLACSGFGYWSHDIGGFEGTPDPLLFKRWIAFGLLSSHSRLHGSNSYRVPWLFDEESVDVMREFTLLKEQLRPYLLNTAEAAHAHGHPMMRPMFMQFPRDPGARDLDLQYMLGPDLLVAPVFRPDGSVDVYLPQGVWRHLIDGEVIDCTDGGRFVNRVYDVHSLGLFAREGSTPISLVQAARSTT
ncbi:MULTISPECIES: alpha-xylosidase [unclassified Actinomyces]|uniref:alpha-xylosidase n=1 Tax=unclassified Actinomyces TaxID=2609248 RepID=UPI002017F31C|nr:MULTISPECIES: alpha-xylosidase [unclassified Actinomyces]MCL3778230.1 alpha-xylosidase [Actinomyces sp. AC-20-1]MCL3789133.1 alpha-xylosidase [Actinomyces sp. 187325]MCL3791488.1 alpha-xylosidase [Actinomyces sp. 186855]MCL3794078.1 alpha-xylosidase [Actinomyces sp. 217892]